MTRDRSQDGPDVKSRDYRPEVRLYVAEYTRGDDDFGRLAFHTSGEAKRWLAGQTNRDDLDYQQVNPMTWEATTDYGLQATIRETRVTQPVRLLRDGRSRDGSQARGGSGES